MKRLVLFVWLILLAAIGRGVAYDGPSLVTYDKTLNGIRVVLTTQTQLLSGGLTSFRMVAYIPVVASSLGGSINLEVRKYLASGDTTILSCSYEPEEFEVGTTVAYECDGFEVVPDVGPVGGTVRIYPYAERVSPSGFVLFHDGRNYSADHLRPTVVGDDAYEENDTRQTAPTIGTGATPISLPSLASMDPDYFSFGVPPGMGSVEVRAEFWEQAADLDLYVLDANGATLASGLGIVDGERVKVAVTPGSTYYVFVDNPLGTPAFYDLTVIVDLPDVITVSAGPTGAPNPVASGGTVNMSVTATDSAGHPLSYAWQSSCPTLTIGRFNSRTVPSPVWTAPVNLSGVQKTCTIKVTIDDGTGITLDRTYVQLVDPQPDTVEITAGPDGTPNPVAPAWPVTLGVTAVDSHEHALTYAWSAACDPDLSSTGSFSPSASAPAPTWIAPNNPEVTERSCTLSVTVSDAFGHSASGSYVQQVAAAGTCAFAVTPAQNSAGADGAAGSLQVVASDQACAWTAVSNSSWIAITGSGGGVGDGTATYQVNPSSEAESRTGTLTVGGQTVQVTQAGTGYRYYFAEGATINGFFETRFALLALTAANVQISFQLKDTTTVLTHTLIVDAGQRVTLDVSKLKDINPALAPLVSAEFSTVIRSDVPLVADRTMTWDSRGYGSHAETSIAAPAATWYLAEGATIGDFELYYLIQNPNPVPVTYEVTYLLPPPAAPVVRSYAVGANTRTNIAVHAEPGLENAEVSAIIRAPEATPIIVERAMYLSGAGLFYGAGHESAGITAPATQWFFAEGATGAFFDLFILVANPNDTGTPVTATFLFDDGTSCSKTVGNAWEGGVLVVGPKSRYNIWVDAESIPGCPRSLADAAVSTTITSTQPVIAERTMWWPGPTAGSWAETHNAPGATKTGTLWGLADGEQGGTRATETYLLIANTSPYQGLAEVRLSFEDGSTLTKQVTLPANSRTNVPVGAPVDAGGFGPGVANKRFGAVVESLPVAGQPGAAEIVVERAMYSNGPGAAFWAAGTDVLATRLR